MAQPVQRFTDLTIQRLALGLGHFGLEGPLSNLHELIERGVIGGRDIGDNFPVQGYFGGLQTFHQTAVSSAGRARGGIDADLPKGSEVSLFGLPIAKGVCPSMIKSIGCVAIKFRAAHPKAFGGADCARAAFSGRWGVCNSHKNPRSEKWSV